ncbi:DMT family transporter [Nocardioides caldifontis]|uniref:DMT family transporter n=1 Tax=Nocardioides caldifontis TaxID=2588938 RepID=UPI0011DF1986|nr:DMT family transporter [Nocardioides caldifontis]
MAVLLALVSGGLWGSADFLGGLLSRRRSAYAVVGASQVAGLLAATVVALVSGGFHSPLGWVVPSVLAAAGGSIALVAFYAAMASGTMGVVSPIAALGAIVPVLGGLLAGEEPSALAGAGIVVGLLGAVLASGPELRGGTGARPLLLAVVAGFAFGFGMLFIARGAETDAVMTVWGMRLTGAFLFLSVAVALRSTGGLRLADTGPLVVVGTGAVGANVLFGLASQLGYVSITSVLASLYPVVTVLLARAVLQERMLRVQYAGVAAALAGVALVSVG